LNFKETKLNALYTFGSGLSKGKKFFGYGYPFLSYKTIFNNYYLPNRLNDLVDATEIERKKCSIKRGDVFLTRTSETVDEIGISSVALKTYPNATFNGFSKRLRPITDDILPEYAAYYFRSRYFRTKASSLCTLITRASLNNNDLSYLTILYPEFAVQKKFASLLLSYDKLIENNTRRIQILEEMAQRIYKEWFVDFRYPGHENDELVDSELGMIPEGWELKRFGDIFDTKYGKGLSTKYVQKTGLYPVYGAGDVIGYYDEYVSENKVALITCRGNGSGTVWRTRETAYVTNNSFLIIPKEDFESLEYHLVEQFCKNINIRSVITGSAQPQITITNLSTINCLCLPNDLLIKYSESFRCLSEKIDNLYEINENLRQTRDLLLPKLISGKVDVSDLDIDTSILDD
jgi:type I restriction enzyme, S subunit